MASIKFDSTEILNTTYIPRFIKHESAPERILDLFNLIREDGNILVSEKYGKKMILLQGILVGTSEADLESKIDSFKELFSRLEKNLDISWNSETRRYVATCLRHGFNRDFYNLLFVPWTAEFLVASGEGKDTTTTKALDEKVISVASPATDSFIMLGSKGAKPQITLEGSSYPGGAKGLQLENLDNGEKITINLNEVWGTDTLKILCDEKEVIWDQPIVGEKEIDFYGIFPNFKIGTNNFELTSGGIICQEVDFDPADIALSTNISDTSKYKAQGFEVPNRDETFKGISVIVNKTGTPTGDLVAEIQTDNGGEPSGSVVTGATINIAPADVGLTFAWITEYASSLYTLEANTKYWIVFNATGVDASNYYSIGYLGSTNATYTKGNSAYSDDAEATWTDEPTKDLAFKIRFGGEPSSGSVKMTVEYYKTYL